MGHEIVAQRARTGQHRPRVEIGARDVAKRRLDRLEQGDDPGIARGAELAPGFRRDQRRERPEFVD
jgi:hypothetical protein